MSEILIAGKFTQQELDSINPRKWMVLANQILGELSDGAQKSGYQTENTNLSDAQITVNSIWQEVKRIQKSLDPYGQPVYSTTRLVAKDEKQSYWGFFSYQKFPFEPQKIRRI